MESKMSATTAWILILLGLIASAVAGFLLGRQTSHHRQETQSLKAELEKQRQELAEYRQSVNQHFEKTASLFTSMAGSYRDLYDHLSESYSRLADAPAQRLLPDYPGALLEGRSRPVAPEAASGAAEEEDSGLETTARNTPVSDDDEHMMGDAPHIPEHVEMEESPERPVTARRDEPAADVTGETNGSGERVPEPGETREGTGRERS
jgi:uncharacterized membrane-anchored protein YhcB (DUF1043 family)